jgi:hypothetical protein
LFAFCQEGYLGLASNGILAIRNRGEEEGDGMVGTSTWGKNRGASPSEISDRSAPGRIHKPSYDIMRIGEGLVPALGARLCGPQLRDRTVRRFNGCLFVSTKIVPGFMQISLCRLETIDGLIDVRATGRQWNGQGYYGGVGDRR